MHAFDHVLRRVLAIFFELDGRRTHVAGGGVRSPAGANVRSGGGEDGHDIGVCHESFIDLVHRFRGLGIRRADGQFDVDGEVAAIGLGPRLATY